MVENNSQEDRHSLFGFLKAKISQTLAVVPFSHDLEARIQVAIEKALLVLNVPTKNEVDDLHVRLDQMLDRCDDLLKKQKAP